eukprot:CAMPEP_0174727354 /NCGR_PEP_ID=MMETSP1094-20130205/49608_1 /TAXON_ID=156173 /ORGANISM="Chrysochromulina brevifilum, Strain UTEX LB 985" /LENGTH=440 /DNA_ID=CAMNT_0015929075 /DNA_START=40 /DNA_END=1362 /DNA_ORIENTATION=+
MDGSATHLIRQRPVLHEGYNIDGSVPHLINVPCSLEITPLVITTSHHSSVEEKPPSAPKPQRKTRGSAFKPSAAKAQNTHSAEEINPYYSTQPPPEASRASFARELEQRLKALTAIQTPIVSPVSLTTDSSSESSSETACDRPSQPVPMRSIGQAPLRETTLPAKLHDALRKPYNGVHMRHEVPSTVLLAAPSAVPWEKGAVETSGARRQPERHVVRPLSATRQSSRARQAARPAIGRTSPREHNAQTGHPVSQHACNHSVVSPYSLASPRRQLHTKRQQQLRTPACLAVASAAARGAVGQGAVRRGASGSGTPLGGVGTRRCDTIAASTLDARLQTFLNTQLRLRAGASGMGGHGGAGGQQAYGHCATLTLSHSAALGQSATGSLRTAALAARRLSQAQPWQSQAQPQLRSRGQAHLWTQRATHAARPHTRLAMVSIGA